MKKEGAGFDLPVAAAVLAAAEYSGTEAIGAGHGSRRDQPQRGDPWSFRNPSRVIRARELGFCFCIIPQENIKKGKLSGYAGIWSENSERYDKVSERSRRNMEMKRNRIRKRKAERAKEDWILRMCAVRKEQDGLLRLQSAVFTISAYPTVSFRQDYAGQKTANDHAR